MSNGSFKSECPSQGKPTEFIDSSLKKSVFNYLTYLILEMLLFLLSVVCGFVLSPYHIYRNPKVYYVDSSLAFALNNVKKEYRKWGHMLVYQNTTLNSSGTIRLSNAGYFGKTVIDTVTSTTNITVKTELLRYPNLLYNVLLHEVGHSLGLKHSDKYGIMNYSLLTINNIPLNANKRALSYDDILGLYYAQLYKSDE